MYLDGIFEMFDWLKNKTKKSATQRTQETENKLPPPLEKTAKEIATENGEPYVSVVQVELDPNDVGNGAFELDWNDIFVARLVKAGYMLKQSDTDSEIVDRWFQSICRNILNENFEQWEVNQPWDARPRRVDRNDLGNGRTEIS